MLISVFRCTNTKHLPKFRKADIKFISKFDSLFTITLRKLCFRGYQASIVLCLAIIYNATLILWHYFVIVINDGHFCTHFIAVYDLTGFIILSSHCDDIRNIMIRTKFKILTMYCMLSGCIILFSPRNRWLIAIRHTQVIISIRDFFFFYLPWTTRLNQCNSHAHNHEKKTSVRVIGLLNTGKQYKNEPVSDSKRKCHAYRWGVSRNYCIYYKHTSLI